MVLVYSCSGGNNSSCDDQVKCGDNSSCCNNSLASVVIW